MSSVQPEITMQTLSTPLTARNHPLAIAAAASVIVVSLVGTAAILGWLPSSNSTTLQSATATAPLPVQQPIALTAAPVAAPLQVNATRFQTADGRTFEEVNPAEPRVVPQAIDKPAPVAHRKVVHHAAQTSESQPQYAQQPPAASPHTVGNYVSDMSPVGTGIGAVAGGVLGNQVGGGNGKKLATVAGVLLGGYVGNEVAHDRNPLPGTQK
jgi:hypothetical protein